MPSEVQLVDITRSFGETIAVNQLNLEIAQGEFFAFLGPSGCGKTTTLRMIAGLERPTSGEIWIRGRPITDVPPHKRNIGMVFQDYALFPHMTIFDNIAFGLRMKHWSKEKVATRVKELLDLIRLPGIADRYPAQISGGQRQRVALARALAPEPQVLLLDEPLSNLDLKLRQELRLELRRIQRALKITTIFVTHDQGEALSLSDRIMLMRDGRSVQQGSPFDIYMRPRYGWAATFLGDANSFRGEVKADNGHAVSFVAKSGLSIRISDFSHPKDGLRQGERTIAIRPELVRLYPSDATVDQARYSVSQGRVENFAYVGSGTWYVVQLSQYPSEMVYISVSDPSAPWKEGTPVQVAFPDEGWIFLED